MKGSKGAWNKRVSMAARRYAIEAWWHGDVLEQLLSYAGYRADCLSACSRGGGVDTVEGLRVHMAEKLLFGEDPQRLRIVVRCLCIRETIVRLL